MCHYCHLIFKSFTEPSIIDLINIKTLLCLCLHVYPHVINIEWSALVNSVKVREDLGITAIHRCGYTPNSLGHDPWVWGALPSRHPANLNLKLIKHPCRYIELHLHCEGQESLVKKEGNLQERHSWPKHLCSCSCRGGNKNVSMIFSPVYFPTCVFTWTFESINAFFKYERPKNRARGSKNGSSYTFFFSP